jgi:signal transduction histidine kinase
MGAVAIDNARLYEDSEHRRRQLERAVRSLEAARDIAEAITGASALERILELIVKRGRALVEARSVVMMLREGDDLIIEASAGYAGGARGHRLSISRSTSGEVLRRGRPERLTDATRDLRIAPIELGVHDARCALLVPMMHREVGIGVLAAFDRGPEREPFTADDEQLLRTFAASAASAVAANRSVEAERLQSAIAAADAERSRWARELHDETLQALGRLRVLLASTVGRGDAESRDQAMRQAIEDIELEIGNLRGIISDLRPSLLDDLGLLPAIEALLDRRRDAGLEVSSEISLTDASDGTAALSPELETTAYRLVQESLTNVVKHANATSVHVRVAAEEGRLVVEVRDDGRGFDPEARTAGFGLAGMRERVYLAGGELEVRPDETGTVVRSTLPVTPQGDLGIRPSAHQAAS